MKLCQSHWDQLRAAIDDRGLSSLVAPSGEALVGRIGDELRGAPDKQTFDPLMGANMAICGNAISAGGLYLLTGDYCPICESEAHGGHDAEWWISHAADEQHKKAQALGLAPKDQ